MRKSFAKVTEKIITENENTFLLLGDIGVFGFRKILEKYPQRVVNMGILEQSMIGIAAGLAKSGMRPIVHTIAPFLVERAHEQLKIDFGYQKLAGNFVSVGASYDYSSLGGTHHAPGDVETLIGIPGFQICIPGHAMELENQLLQYFDNNLPTYFRISESTNHDPMLNHELTVVRVKQGGSATVIAVGPYLDRTMRAVETLDCEVIYLNQISAKTSSELNILISNNRLILVEPFYEGTLNHLIAQSTSGRLTEIYNIGVPRHFIHNYGSTSEIDELLGLSTEKIAQRIMRFLT